MEVMLGIFLFVVLVSSSVVLYRLISPGKRQPEGCECCLSHSFEVETPVL